jgi:CopA family copper-resistance protein
MCDYSQEAGGVPSTRRDFLRIIGGASVWAMTGQLWPTWAQSNAGVTPSRSRGSQFHRTELVIDQTDLRIGGRFGRPVTVNGTLPAPLLRYREGDDVELRVTNRLAERTSIHWHGILLPNDMDGVPGVTFKGIDPGETFAYRFPLRQYGTYWYHSHSGMQAQLGLYGPFVIDPAEPEPFEYDREHILVLSDWTFDDPHRLFAKLKKQSNFSNMQRQTLLELVDLAREKGMRQAWSDWVMWSKMRMDPTDIADLTGAHFTFLINGQTAGFPWTGLFRAGERVRLRIINSAATTHYDLRIPGLTMTVVQADGQHVKPVEVEELRMGAAETYDVIVHPTEERAYAVFAETTDRSGYALAALAPRHGMVPTIPERRKRPLRTMADMGMGSMEDPTAARKGSEHAGHATHAETPPSRSHDSQSTHSGHAPPKQEEHSEHSGHDMPSGKKSGSDERSGMNHGDMKMPENQFGPGNSMMAMSPVSRAHEPGTGLGEDGRRVLVYRDLVAHDERQMPNPTREIVLNITGNMEKFIWGFDGKKFSESEPVRLHHGERVRVTFINHTMMEHPLHLHGMFMELENGAKGLPPLKHTVTVKPGEKISVLVTADVPGDWAFHCHLQYHMEAGMFRVFSVA